MKGQEKPYIQLPKPVTVFRVSFSPQPGEQTSVTEEKIQLELETSTSPGGIAGLFCRDRMKDLIHSTYYQVGLISLVVVEACVVVAELLVEAQEGDYHHVVEALHIAALALLSIFLLELVIKLAVLRKEMLRSWVEMLDGTVVVVATGLEAASFHHRGAMQAGGLLLTLRLWRIFRVQNSLVAAAHLSGERKLESEKRSRKLLEEELVQKQNTIDKLEARCSALELSLVQQGITPPRAQGKDSVDLTKGDRTPNAELKENDSLS